MGTSTRADPNGGVGRHFDSRASRAESLSSLASVDLEPLRFATLLLRAQGTAAVALETVHASLPLSGDPALDLERISTPLRTVFGVLERKGPAGIASLARTRAAEDDQILAARLAIYWAGDRSAAEDTLSRAILRPYVETLRHLGVGPKRRLARGHCPACGGGAGVGRRRSGESQGAVRSLLCALCGLEWETPRIRCPACFEGDPTKLPSFSSETHPIVRIEACETCRRYVKSLDTSLDERILPEVDDLLSLSLDLWAREEGFERLEPGVAGI